MSKGEWRSPSPVVDAVRFWGGVTDYKHNELGLADDTNPASDGIRQTFTNKEQEGRMEAQLVPFDLRFATLTTAIGIQCGHQELTAPSPDNAGLWDPNSNWRIAGYIFNEFKFSETTKAQIAGRIEQVSLSGVGPQFRRRRDDDLDPGLAELYTQERQRGADPEASVGSRRQHHRAIHRTRT